MAAIIEAAIEAGRGLWPLLGARSKRDLTSMSRLTWAEQPNITYVPVLATCRRDEWAGRTGFVHRVGRLG